MTSLGIVEGIQRELNLIAKSRSQRLRRLALQRAKGICEACGTDFASLFGGMVCANCHALIHANPGATLPVDVVRELWTTWRGAA